MQNHFVILGWERLHPPDLAPSDFHLFPALKKNLTRRHFGSNAVGKQAVKCFFRMKSPDFFSGGLFEAYQAFTNEALYPYRFRSELHWKSELSSETKGCRHAHESPNHSGSEWLPGSPSSSHFLANDPFIKKANHRIRTNCHMVC
ncbi:hypothetical protein TNCV_1245171 [Trichonephila clavipes]|nr:hypothetical protein TNCV_1245171 [Trichonephila clavipes]